MLQQNICRSLLFHCLERKVVCETTGDVVHPQHCNFKRPKSSKFNTSRTLENVYSVAIFKVPLALIKKQWKKTSGEIA